MRQLRQVQTAFVQDQFDVRGSFETEPYEAGWASEAIAFVYVRSAPAPAPDGQTPSLRIRAQISGDGRRWIDDEAFPPITGAGSYRLRLTHFGNWLRLAASVDGTSDRTSDGSGDGSGDGSSDGFVIDTYWVFKE